MQSHARHRWAARCRRRRSGNPWRSSTRKQRPIETRCDAAPPRALVHVAGDIHGPLVGEAIAVLRGVGVAHDSLAVALDDEPRIRAQRLIDARAHLVHGRRIELEGDERVLARWARRSRGSCAASDGRQANRQRCPAGADTGTPPASAAHHALALPALVDPDDLPALEARLLEGADRGDVAFDGTRDARAHAVRANTTSSTKWRTHRAPRPRARRLASPMKRSTPARGLRSRARARSPGRLADGIGLDVGAVGPSTLTMTRAPRSSLGARRVLRDDLGEGRRRRRVPPRHVRAPQPQVHRLHVVDGERRNVISPIASEPQAISASSFSIASPDWRTYPPAKRFAWLSTW